MTADIKKRFTACLEQGILVSDGGIGTLLQAEGLAPGQMPEIMVLEKPEKVRDVHRSYLAAGAGIITTNTFGATRGKLAEFGLSDQLERINFKAVTLARDAAGDKAFVAGSIGPTGLLLHPMGPAGIDQMEALFAEQAACIKRAGADFAIVETMGDVGEAAAAVRSCHRLGLPVIASMTFNQQYRSLTGSPPEVIPAILEPFKPLAVGTNCGMGPGGMIEIVRIMSRSTHLPVIAQPNAGLPRYVAGRTEFQMSPDEFAAGVMVMAEAGAGILGGCCGTTPDHIAALARSLQGFRVELKKTGRGIKFASRTRVFIFGNGHPFGIIGERINPTGRKKLSSQFKSRDFSMAKLDAGKQIRAGAHLLDINVGVPDTDEKSNMQLLVEEIQSVLPDAGFSIDSNDEEVLEAGIRAVIGRSLLNSINGEDRKMESLFPLVLDTGSNFIALAMDETGIPKTSQQRLAVIRRIVDQAQKAGIDRNRILIDCLVFTVGSQPDQAMETLRAVRDVTEELGCATVLGISNVSYGLPNRELIASVFLAMAQSAGLNAGIINPLSPIMMQTLKSTELLLNRDPGAKQFLNFIQRIQPEERISIPTEKANRIDTPSQEQSRNGQPAGLPEVIRKTIIEGDKSSIRSVIHQSLESGLSPDEILRGSLLPAIMEVGDRYGRGLLFLPQLILAGETMRLAVQILKPQLLASGAKTLHSTPFVLGTVEGDNHDIGKNILAIVLENQGFRVIDLGKNVSADRFAEEVDRNQANLVGLSALMTTTLPSMEQTVRFLKMNRPGIRVFVGGAVVTRAFSERIGADGYAKDAVSAGPLVLEIAGLTDRKA
ncbi:homocysteine S-methyltransferase family protein [bacterium]|nr:homocysteine S-methyltransferase family protein [candidate division CSSED10-310 bacterium]